MRRCLDQSPRVCRQTASSAAEHPRRGTMIVLCIICLVLLTMTVAVLVRAAGLQRDQTRTLLPQTQADWLAHAAAQTAADRLQADNTWSGDTWTVAADETTGLDAARLTVQITADATGPSRRTALISVDYPPDAPDRVHVEHRVVIDVDRSDE